MEFYLNYKCVFYKSFQISLLEMRNKIIGLKITTKYKFLNNKNFLIFNRLRVLISPD